MLQPNPQATTTWPIAGDVPPLEAIITAQAATISRQFALLHDYQDVLDAAQAPSSASGTATATGTSLAVTAVTGTIIIGAVVAGTGVPGGTTITSQVSGTLGGAGAYTTSVATTAAAAALTFTWTPTSWPGPADAPTLNLIVQSQTGVIRNQAALIQQYQDLLNTSATNPPPSGP